MARPRNRPGACAALALGLLPWCGGPAPAVAAPPAVPPLPDHVVRLDCPTSGGSEGTLLKPGVTAIAFDAPAGAVWQLDELGVEVQTSVPPAADFASVGRRPARLGTALGPVHPSASLTVRSTGPSTVAAVARLRLHCLQGEAIRQALDCNQGAGSWPAADPYAAMAQVERTNCLAPALLDRASTAYRGGDLGRAERIYREVAGLWSDHGEPARAGAAMLGLAEVLTRQGRHAEALGHAQDGERLARAGGVEYYALRARAQQCLALRSLGRYREAAHCTDPVPQGYLAIGEISEAANAWHAIAAMAREDGEQSRARQALAHALELPESAISDMVAGRLSQVGAGLAADSGHVHSALDLLDDALQRFERVRAPIWIGGAYLAAARLHIALGADAEAAALVAAAEHQFRIAQSPERTAGAMMLRARIEAGRGAIGPAIAHVDAAGRLYRTGARPQLQLAAALLALSIEPSDTRFQQVRALSSADVQLPPRARFDLAAGLAGFHLDRGDHAAARVHLDGVAGDVPDLERRIRFELLMARLDAGAGHPERSRDRLERAMATLRAMAADVASPALRQIAGRRLLQLRAGWLATLAAGDLAEPGMAERAFGMVVRTQPLALLDSVPRPGGADRHSSQRPPMPMQEHLARAMLGQAEGDTQAMARLQRLVWARYRDSGAGKPTSVAWTPRDLRSLRSGLAEGELILAFGLAEPASVALLVGRDHLSMHRVAGAAIIRDAAGQLIELASDRGASIERIDRAAQRVAEALLPAAAPAAPKRLWIVAEEALAAVPFGLLSWPGTGAVLVDTTRTSVGPLLPRPTLQSPGLQDRHAIHVLAAAGSGGADADLPALASVVQEPAWIRQALPSHATTTATLQLDALRQSLAVPGLWIHVAGHGRSRDGLQGHSGLWLDPLDHGLQPVFISWLDLVDARPNAQLLVLNACDLAAAGAGPISRSSGFGSALQAAGVEHVVAALWPVSDSAAALWVPAFYQTLARQRDVGHFDPSGAVVAAQRRLRASRVFRHPFFWASMVHIAGPRLSTNPCASDGPDACRPGESERPVADAGPDRRGALASGSPW